MQPTSVKTNVASPVESIQQEVMLCINCKEAIINNFCGNCGQPKNVKRITFSTLLADVYDRLFAMDNKFTRTTFYLFKNPEIVIGEILKGNRVRFFGAAGLYFLLLTLYLLLASMFDVSLKELTSSVQEAMVSDDISSRQVEFGNKVNDILFNNFRIFGFILVPFFSFALMLCYRKSSLNFFEHSVVIFYAFAVGMLVAILGLLAYVIMGESFQMSQMVLNLGLFAYIVARFYHKKIIGGLFKGLLVYGIGYFLFLLTFMIVLIVAIAINPGIIGI